MELNAKIPDGPVHEKWDKHRFEMKLVNPANKRKYNVIVVGSGLAGAAAAASLGELVAAVVQGGSPEGARLHAQGPPVTIAPKMAVTLAMTLNELYTNAVKYGALAVDDGRIDLAWSYDAADRVTLSWREHGGPPVAPPARKGFGLTMIEQALTR